MNTTLTIKMPKKLRDDAKRTAHSMGVPLTTAVNAMLKKFVNDQVLVLEAECPFPSHTPNADTRKALLDRSRRGSKTFKTVEEVRKYVATL